jgi:hypothetical protein
MFLKSRETLSASYFSRTPRASLIAVTNAACLDEEDDIRLDWRKTSLPLTELKRVLGRGWKKRAADILLETFDEEALHTHLLNLTTRVLSCGIEEAADERPLVIVARRGGHEIMTWASILLVADTLGVEKVPAFLAQEGTVGPDDWELRHVLH